MSVAASTVEVQVNDVATGVAEPVALQTYDLSWITVRYGDESKIGAVLNTDYTLELSGDFATVTVTPTQSLIDKIEALGEANAIFVRRVLPTTSDITENDVQFREKIVEQFDKLHMVAQQQAFDIGNIPQQDVTDDVYDARDAAIAAAAAADVSAEFASDEADRAETAASNAAAIVGLYENTTAGIANTVDGEVFAIPGAASTAALDLYRNDSEVATDLGKSIPSTTLINNMVAQLAIIDDGVYRTNLFDVTTFNDNFLVNHTTGALNSNANHWASDFIPVVAGEEYTLSMQRNIAWYNDLQDSGGFISGSNTVETPSTVTAPVGATWMRCSTQTADFNQANFMVVHGDTLPDSYIPFDLVLDGAKLLPGTVGTSALVDEAITFDKVNFLKKSKNLFDDSSLTPGFMSAAGGVTASDDYFHSDYIPVEPSTEYHGEGVNQMRMWCFFSAVGVVAAGGSNSPGNGFTTSASTHFVRITVYDEDEVGSFQFEEGSVKTSYVPFGFKLDPDGYGATDDTGGWAGMTWGLMGDSNVDGDDWPGQLAAAFGLLYTSYGEGGTLVSGSGSTAMNNDARVDAIDVDTDVVMVMGGTNDWFNNVALGAANSVTVTQFNGALNVMIEKLLARFPDKIIAMVTPPYTEALTYVAKGWSNAYTNTQALTPKDYADAVRAACVRYNLPCIDLQAEGGWNNLNITSFVNNDGELLHFNSLGRTRVKSVYAGFFRKFEPV